MATRAQPVRMGPWTGGLNLYSDESAIGDDDAVDLTNFEVDLDGSLKSRPPIVAITSGIGARYNNRMLGIYIHPSGTNYFIFSSTDAAGANPSTNYYNLNTGAFGTIVSTYGATAFVQYQNKAWLVSDPGQAINGGWWDGTTYTTVATQPKGISACVYKEQIYIATGASSANPAQVYYSDLGIPDSWTSGNQFLAGNGDGQAIRKIYSFIGSIIVFKTRSTYVFAYESDPKRAQVQSISSTVGVDGVDAMTENDSILYVLSNNDLYAISNWIFERLNIKVPFQFSDSHVGQTRTAYHLSSMGDRIICRFYDTYYIFNIKTRTFTQWKSNLTPGGFFRSPVFDTASGLDTYIGGNYLTAAAGSASNSIHRIRDGHTATDSEVYTATLKTKVYSMNVPYSFKRMMWWGIDLLAKSNVVCVATPVAYGSPVYWKDLPPRTWADMSPHTWGSPLDIDITVQDNSDIKNSQGVRMFVKYLKSLRFRQLQYTVSSQLDGTTGTGPFQIFSITSYIINKELVPKKIN